MTERMDIPVTEALSKKESKARRKVEKKLRKLERKGHKEAKISTTSIPKLEGMSGPYVRHNFEFSSFNMEGYGYSEPPYEVFETLDSKAFSGERIILYGNNRRERRYRDSSVEFEIINKEHIPHIAEDKDVLIDVMDVTTTVNGMPLLKLDRHPEYPTLDLKPDRAQEILEQDKNEIRHLYKKDFEVIFEAGRGILSTKRNIANSLAIRYIVQFKALSDEIIDLAYASKNIWKVGPRVNLALLVVEHPELIKKVEAVDMSDPKEKKKELKPRDYYQVTDFVVNGKVSYTNMLELLKKRKSKDRESLKRRRANI